MKKKSTRILQFCLGKLRVVILDHGKTRAERIIRGRQARQERARAIYHGLGARHMSYHGLGSRYVAYRCNLA